MSNLQAEEYKNFEEIKNVKEDIWDYWPFSWGQEDGRNRE